MQDVSLGDETEIGVVFIDLPFMITMLIDLAALKARPVHFGGIVQREKKAFPPYSYSTTGKQSFCTTKSGRHYV